MFSLDETVGLLWPLHPELNPFQPGPLKSCSCGKTRGWQSGLEQASSSSLFFQTGAGHQGLVLEPMQQYPEMLFKWLQESFSKQESIERNGRKPRWVSISMEAAFTSSIVNCGVPLWSVRHYEMAIKAKGLLESSLPLLVSLKCLS